MLRAFFLCGLLFIVAAGITGIAQAATHAPWLHWLALHLVFVGGISQLVLGAGQFFACAFLATDPPPRRLVNAQLIVWNAGTVLVAAGVPSDQTILVEIGAGLIAAGLILFAVAMDRMRRRSLQRAPWALRWYQASAACLGIGALIGVLMARGTLWTHGDLLAAHLALNLAGWLGTAIVGTLHTFFPSLTQTQLRHPRLQRPTYLLWLLGVALLAIGGAFASAAILFAGWTALLAAAAILGANIIAALRTAPRPLTLPARLLAAGHAFLLVGLAVAFIGTITAGIDGPFLGTTRAALAALLLAGWIGLTVTGSLLHLLAILARIRSFATALPTPAPTRDRALTASAAVAVTILAVSAGDSWLGTVAAVPALGVALVLLARIAVLARRALAPRRPARV